MKIIYSLIVVVSLLTSCSNSYSPEIKVIDSLLVALDSSKTVLYNLDTGQVYRRIKTCTRNINYIYNNDDTVNREQAFFIDDYSLCRKYYGKIAQKFPRLFEEIETVPKQLENLKRDLSKNLISQDKAAKFLAEEQRAAEIIVENILQIAERFKSLDKSFIESHEKILNLIQTIDSSKEANPES